MTAPTPGGAAATAMVRVLIVDDHPTFRSLARRMLEAEGLDVVAEAGTVAAARAAASAERPDLVLLDIHLPDGDGYALAAELTRAADGPAVVLISTHESADVEPLVVSSGARGFVAKHLLSGAAVTGLLR